MPYKGLYVTANSLSKLIDQASFRQSISIPLTLNYQLRYASSLDNLVAICESPGNASVLLSAHLCRSL